MYEIIVDRDECFADYEKSLEQALETERKKYATLAAAARRLVEAGREYDAAMRQSNPWPSNRMMHAVIDNFKAALAEVEDILGEG